MGGALCDARPRPTPDSPGVQHVTQTTNIARNITRTTLEILPGNPPGLRLTLNRTEGAPITMHGSATPNRTLSDATLIDRRHLLVLPVLLGAGKRLSSHDTVASVTR